MSSRRRKALKEEHWISRAVVVMVHPALPFLRRLGVEVQARGTGR